MSAIRAALHCATLVCLSCGVVWAQNAATQSTSGASTAPGQGSPEAQKTSPESTQQADQPVSLAEAARLARANKANASKPARNYDDDNFVRSVPIVKKKGTESAPENPSIQDLPSEQMRGKVVLLDFWASWCGPCRSALPKLKQLQSVYTSDDFMVISISEDEDETSWRGFVASHQMTWTQRFDANSSLLRRYQVSGLPTYVLLGRDGQELQRYEGEDPGQSILERIGPELKQALQIGK